MNKDLIGCYLILMVFRNDLRFDSQLAMRRGELKPEGVTISDLQR